MQTLPEYVLARVPQRKHELVQSGVDVIDLGPGDADLAPPAAAIERLNEAARIPSMQRYGFGLGLVAFRETVSKWMHRRFGLHFDPIKEIVPLIGSKEGITHTAFSYVEPGQCTIVPEPGYASYIGGGPLPPAGGPPPSPPPRPPLFLRAVSPPPPPRPATPTPNP